MNPIAREEEFSFTHRIGDKAPRYQPIVIVPPADEEVIASALAEAIEEFGADNLARSLIEEPWMIIQPVRLDAGCSLHATFRNQTYLIHATSDQTITGFRVVDGEADWQITYHA
jgi:hypothetical protein